MPRNNTCFTEAHFCVLPSQSNVYGMCQFTTGSCREKVLVASLTGQITLFEYTRSEETGLKPESNPVNLKYMPAHAEIVSIDAFTKRDSLGSSSTIVIAITFIEQEEQDTAERFKINILTASLTGPDQKFTNTQSVTEGGLPANLGSTPCQITHTDIYSQDKSTTVFVVSTTDRRIHVFTEHCVDGGDGTYREKAVEEYFPELAGIQEDTVFFMDILYFDDHKKRITCTGSQSGKVKGYIMDVENLTVLKEWNAVGMGPVTSIKLFEEIADVPIPHFLDSLYIADIPVHPLVHVMVSHALEVSSVYRDIMKNGLGEQITLQSSYNYDSVLCSCVTDVDFDGRNEIIVGTYGQRILAYKFDSSAPANECTTLLWEHSLPYPIHSLMPLDLTGDGLKDLAVLSMGGLHILQKDIAKAAELIHERIVDLTDAFDSLNKKQPNDSISQTRQITDDR